MPHGDESLYTEEVFAFVELCPNPRNLLYVWDSSCGDGNGFREKTAIENCGCSTMDWRAEEGHFIWLWVGYSRLLLYQLKLNMQISIQGNTLPLLVPAASLYDHQYVPSVVAEGVIATWVGNLSQG